MPHPKGKLDKHQLKEQKTHDIEEKIFSILSGNPRGYTERGIQRALRPVLPRISISTVQGYLYQMLRALRVRKVKVGARYQWFVQVFSSAHDIGASEPYANNAKKWGEIQLREWRRKSLSQKIFDQLYPLSEGQKKFERTYPQSSKKNVLPK